MSKGNLFLGQARGSVGDVTFTHIDGVQVARARNRSPRNPRVPSQMLQRIVLNSASKAYSLMQAIVDHSYEGVAGRARNQQRFMTINTAALRDKLADVIADPTEQNALASTATSYSFKGDFYPQLNPFVISEGTLPRQLVTCLSASNPVFVLRMPVNPATVLSYADVVQALDIQQGDQLTFIGLGHQYGSEDNYDQVSAFAFARVIMEPAGGDMSINFLGDDDRPNDPNSKNQGDVSLSIASDASGNYLEFSFTSMTNTNSETIPSMVGAAVILSRFESGRWRRSPQSIVLAKFGDSLSPLNTATFGAAYASYLLGDSSNLYLNGSPVGAPAAAPQEQSYQITTLTVGGEEYAKGSIVAGDMFDETVHIEGTNLSNAYIKLVNVTTEATVTPSVYDNVEYTAQVPAAGSILQLYVGGEVWCTLFASN